MIEPRRTEILDLIEKRKKDKQVTTQHDVAVGLDIFPSNVSRMMRRLVELKLVERLPHPNRPKASIYVIAKNVHRTAYGWISVTDMDPDKVMEALDTIDVGVIKPGLLQGFLQTWGSKKWEPKLLKSYPSLPMTIAGLFSAAVKLGRGERVTQTELSAVVSQLTQLRADLEQMTKTVTSIMNTPALQDPALLTEFLVPDDTYLEAVEALVHRVIDLNVPVDSEIMRDL